MLDFLNSTGLQTAITFLVGLSALIVYRRQKKDKMRSAATILLLEIQQAERAIVRAKEYIRQGDLNVDLHVLRSDTWDNNKYLFTRTFDKDEWDSITDFYDKARLLDDSIRYAKKCFDDDVEQIRVNKQRVLADISKEAVVALQVSGAGSSETIIKNMQDKMNSFDRLYMGQQNQARYNPQKIIDDAQHCIEDLNTLSTTSVGQKLKKIARSKKTASGL